MTKNTEIKIRSAEEILNTMKKMEKIEWYNTTNDVLLNAYVENDSISESQCFDMIRKMKSLWDEDDEKDTSLYHLSKFDDTIWSSRLEALRWVLGADFKLDDLYDEFIHGKTKNIFTGDDFDKESPVEQHDILDEDLDNPVDF